MRISCNKQDPGYSERAFDTRCHVFFNGKRAVGVNTADEELGVIWMMWFHGSKLLQRNVYMPYYGKVKISFIGFNPDGANRKALKRKRKYIRNPYR